MAIYFTLKDKKFRRTAAKFEFKRLRLQFFMRNAILPREAKARLNLMKTGLVAKALMLSVKARNRCVITGRAGSVYRHFRLSRIMAKQLASKGQLTGVRKSS